MDKKETANLFVNAGIISKHELPTVLKENERNPDESMETTLLRLYFTTEQEIARVWARHHKITYISLPDARPDDEAVPLVPLSLASRHLVFPVWVEEDTLVLAMKDPWNTSVKQTLEAVTNKKIHSYIAASVDIHQAINSAYGLDTAVADYLKNIPPPRDLEIKTDEENHPQSTLTGGTAIRRLVASLLSQGMTQKANQIRVESRDGAFLFQSVMDGQLQEMFQAPQWMEDLFFTRFKSLAGLNPSEKFTFQRGRIQASLKGAPLEFKVSVEPAPRGENITIRFPETDKPVVSLKEMDFSSDILPGLEQIFNRGQGFLLVCGPMGSGRTTTLRGLIREAARRGKKSFFLSESFEEKIEGVQTLEVNLQNGVPYSRALRQAIMHGAEAIVLDDLRDGETAEMALRAALDGRLVVASIHTPNSAAAFRRLWDLRVKRDLIASSLAGILTQRLVRTVCRNCRKERPPLPSSLLKDIAPLYKAGDCAQCGRTGYRGQRPLHEFLPINDVWRKRLITPDLSEDEIRNAAEEEGMISLRARGLEALKNGSTTVEELEHNGLLPHDVFLPPAAAVEEKAGPPAPQVEKVPEKIEEKTFTPCTACGHPLLKDPPIGGRRHYKIFLAEDEKDVADPIIAFLSKKGFDVHHSFDGKESLERVTKEKPHLLITDVQMPGMNGLDLIKKLRGNVTTAFTPVMVISVKEKAEDRLQGFESGTDDYLPKPFHMNELLARINAILKRTYN